MKKNTILILAIFFLLNSSGLLGQSHNLMPQPQNITWGKSNFQITGAKILVSPDLLSREQNSITQFTDFVRQTTGVSISITYSDDHQGRLIILNSEQAGQALPLPNEKPGSQSRESYKISVTPARVQVNTKSDAGLFYSLQTLRQLIVNDQNKSYIPEVEIDD